MLIVILVNLAERGRGILRWSAAHELWLLAAASPVLLFPVGNLPWVGMALIAMTWVGRRVTRGYWTAQTPMDAAIAVILLMMLIGYAISVDHVMSQAKVWGIVLGIAVFYGIVNSMESERHAITAAALISVATVVVSVVSLLGADWHSERIIKIPWIYDNLPSLIRGLPGSGVPRMTDLFNPREVGGTLALLLPGSMTLWFTSLRRLRWLSVATITVGGMTLLLTQTPQALAGIIAAVMLTAIWRKHQLWLVVPLSAIVVLLGVLAIGPLRLAHLILTTDNPLGAGVVLRLDIWSRTWSMIGDMPITGIGINTFPTILSNFYPGYYIGPEPHAHNLFLQTALDLGIPGMVGLVSVLVAFFKLVYRKCQTSANSDYQCVMVGAAASILAFLIYSLIDAITLGAKPSVAFWGILGLAAALPQSVVHNVSPLPRTAFRYLLTVAILLAFGLIVSVSFFPNAWYTNVGAIYAHQALVEARTTHNPNLSILATAKEYLVEATDLDPANAHAYFLLGCVNAWLSEFDQALAAFAREVDLDARDPLGSFNPDEKLKQTILASATPAQTSESLTQIYSQWAARFPDRAESYVQVALVWSRLRASLSRGATVLEQGLKLGAWPPELLAYALSTVIQQK